MLRLSPAFLRAVNGGIWQLCYPACIPRPRPLRHTPIKEKKREKEKKSGLQIYFPHHSISGHPPFPIPTVPFHPPAFSQLHHNLRSLPSYIHPKSNMGKAPQQASQKHRLVGACEFAEKLGLKGYHNEAFRMFGFGKSSGWAALRDPDDETGGASSHTPYDETRGRKKLLSSEDLAKLESLIESEGFDGRTTPWAAMPAAAGLDIQCSGETIRRAMKTRDFRICISCQKQYVSPQLAATREEHSRRMLEKYPDPADWRHIRFTDEIHLGYGPQGTVYICRRPWERACSDCLQREQLQVEKELDPKHKQLHAWAAVGYDGFREGLHWYDAPRNSNGKMSMQVFHDIVLQPVISEWVRRGDHFVMEEDNDSGHGGGCGNNIVRRWKRAHNVNSLFTCSQSPDLIARPIEKAFQHVKEYVRKDPYWDSETVKTAAQEGFDLLSTETVNRWIDGIPQTLKKCIENEGRVATD